MKQRFELIVLLKEGLSDPQGKTIEDALPTLGWRNVSAVKVGKSIQMTVESDSEADAEAQMAEMAVKFLTNPVIERFHVRPMAEEEHPS
jgi:phosphoribosylformylglycinamidine synthase PurS subunit